MSERLYQQRCTGYLRLSRGGFGRMYDIIHRGKTIGVKTVIYATRNAPGVATYTFGPFTFDTAKDFIAAYEASRPRLSLVKGGEAA
jgi:hypothetical protein